MVRHCALDGDLSITLCYVTNLTTQKSVTVNCHMLYIDLGIRLVIYKQPSVIYRPCKRWFR